MRSNVSPRRCVRSTRLRHADRMPARPQSELSPEPDTRAVRAAVVAILTLTALALLLQAGGPAAYLRGDSAYFLRDASTFADGQLARSRYSPGYALFLAPVAALTGDDLALFGRASLLVTAAVAVVALGLVHRVLRRWLPTWLAVATLALLSFGQGVVIYFSEVRSEPLTLLLVAAAVLALLQGSDRWAPVLLGLAVLTRVAMAPFAVGVWVVWFRRSRGTALAGVALCIGGVAAHFATGPTVDEGYVGIGTAVLGTDDGGLLGSLYRRAIEGIEAYGRYGFPRLAWPYVLLRSPAGILAAAAALTAMAVGIVSLLRSRSELGTRRHHVLVASFVGTLAYTALLVAWPIRDLAAVRLVIPGVLVPLAGLAAGTAMAARSLVGVSATGAARLAATAILALASLGAVASAVSVRERRAEGAGLVDYVDAHDAPLPAGPLMSGKPGISELASGRRAYEFPLDPADIEAVAEATGTCLFVLDPTDRDAEETRAAVARYDTRILAASGRTEIIEVTSGWCR